MKNIFHAVLNQTGLIQQTIKDIFNNYTVEGKNHVLTISDIEIIPPNDEDVLRVRQQKGTVLGTAIGTITIKDKNTGKILDKKRAVVARFPSISPITGTFYVDGIDYTVPIQMRLLAGIYVRRKLNNEIEAQFNIKNKEGFRLEFDPKEFKFQFKFSSGSSSIHLGFKTIAELFDISDNDIEKIVGRNNLKFFEISNTRKNSELEKLYRWVFGREPSKNTDVKSELKQYFSDLEVYPDVVKDTIGVETDKVNKQCILKTVDSLLKVYRGEQEPTNRDALYYKEVLLVDDHLKNRFEALSKSVKRKILNVLDKEEKIENIWNSEVASYPFISFFKQSDLAEITRGINPLDLMSALTKITVTGEGGIQNVHGIPIESRLFDASHIGFLDPLHTPEGERVGVTLHVTSTSLISDDHRPASVLINIKTGKPEEHKLIDLKKLYVAFPDEYEKQGNKYTPKSKEVLAVHNGQIVKVPASKIDHIFFKPSSLFTPLSFLIPFPETLSGPRFAYALSHISQALPLKDPDIPKVQSGVHVATSDSIESSNIQIAKYFGTKAPYDMKIEKITNNEVIVRNLKTKEKHSFSLKPFPLTTTGVFTKQVLAPGLKEGSIVRSGEIFLLPLGTKTDANGEIHTVFGKNLRVAYLPWFDDTYEDAIIISESAAEKLTSVHTYEEAAEKSDQVEFNKHKFTALYPNKFKKDQLVNIDERGIVKKGTILNPGDPIILSLKKRTPNEKLILEQGLGKLIYKPYKDNSIVYEGSVPGKVIDVIETDTGIFVTIQTEEKAKIGDKLSGRYGNKGVIAAILPDKEMPKTKDGKPIEILMNPITTAGRTIVGPFLETALAKTVNDGDFIVVPQFGTWAENQMFVNVKGHWRTYHTAEGPVRKYIQPYSYQRNVTELVKKYLEEKGVSDKEPLYDKDGNFLGNVLVGEQYILKQVHQAEKKEAVRGAGPGWGYDGNRAPTSGEGQGGQSIGELGIHSLLAHGATSLLREAQTFKSDASQEDVWTAITLGEPLPPPRPSFAYQKFLAFLEVLGLKPEQKEDVIEFLPLTDDDVKKISKGELKNPNLVLIAKNLKPEEGGLFDEKLTGGFYGTNWTHFTLAEELPNPIFEMPIRTLLDLSASQFEDLLKGKLVVDKKTKELIPYKEAVKENRDFVTGGRAFSFLLSSIDVNKQYDLLMHESAKVSGNDLDKIIKKLKILKALKSRNLDPTVYMRKLVPVIPPVFRPVVISDSGDIIFDSLTGLYKGIALTNQQLKEVPEELPERIRGNLRLELYDGLKALTGLDSNLAKKLEQQGIIDKLHGSEIKHGFFQKALLKRRQDLSARGVIVPDYELDLNEVGLPLHVIKTIYEPFIMKELISMGYSLQDSKKLLENNAEPAMRAINKVIAERPVAMKRDPVLHKHSFMGFYPKIVDGNAFHISPLTVVGFNADHDGDTMAVFVPVTQGAVEEVKKMLPTNILFSPSTGELMYKPRLESALGLFIATKVGKKVDKSFNSIQQIIDAYSKNEIDLNDVVKLNGKETTAGRAILADAINDDEFNEKILHDLDFRFDSKTLEKTLTKLAKKDAQKFGKSVTKLDRIGFKISTMRGVSVGLDDLQTLTKERDKIIRDLEEKIKMIEAKNPRNKIALINEEINKANEKIKKIILDKLKTTDNTLIDAYFAGAKIKYENLRQLIATPLTTSGIFGLVPIPITRSYTEGLKLGEFFLASIGSRKAMFEKTQEVSVPGTLNKILVNASMDMLITQDDCGTKGGVRIKNTDLDKYVGRYTAAPIKLKNGKVIPRNTLITSELLSVIKSSNADQSVVIRSPLYHIGKGVCKYDYGLVPDGTEAKKYQNVGVLASQAVGERGVQLTLKAFHTGGTTTGKEKITTSMDRVRQLLYMPEILPNSAVLAPVSGKIEDISIDKISGSKIVTIKTEKGNREQVFIPANREIKYQKGSIIEKADPLTDGVINPHDLLKLTNIHRVRAYLTDELNKVYEQSGINPIHIETIVRTLTSVGTITDPGDNPNVFKGDRVNIDEIEDWNKKHPDKKPIKYEYNLVSAELVPLEKTTDVLARLAYRKQKETLINAAAFGYQSHLHGLHPVPGLVYGAEFKSKPEYPY
jgi:DNA-directed RNA polymerase subunit beta'